MSAEEMPPLLRWDWSSEGLQMCQTVSPLSCVRRGALRTELVPQTCSSSYRLSLS